MIDFNMTSYGLGIEGWLNWVNIEVAGGFFIPTFLLTFYIAALYVMSKSEWKLGAGISFISLLFFILGMVTQTYTLFNEFIMFVFAIGLIVGIVISYIENARS